MKHLSRLAIAFSVLLTLAWFGGLSPASAAKDQASAEPDRVRVINTAHRGASAYAPENTLAANQVGLEQKADWVESDVQLSKDGVPVLMHDTTLSRTTNVEEVFPDRAPWNVGDFTLAEIKQLDAGSWFSDEYAGEPVPTLAEMIEQIRPSQAGILMELKSPGLYPGIEEKVAETFAKYPGYLNSSLANGRLAVQSFEWDSMALYKKVQPEMPVGLLGTPSVDELPELTWAQQINPRFTDLDQEFVNAIHDLGMEVHTWTVNEAADMNRVLDLGVDGVITNHPDVLNDVLAQR